MGAPALLAFSARQKVGHALLDLTGGDPQPAAALQQRIEHHEVWDVVAKRRLGKHLPGLVERAALEQGVHEEGASRGNTNAPALHRRDLHCGARVGLRAANVAEPVMRLGTEARRDREPE